MYFDYPDQLSEILSWNPMLVFPVWRTPYLPVEFMDVKAWKFRWWIPLAGPGMLALFSNTLCSCQFSLHYGHCVWVESETVLLALRGTPAELLAQSELWSRGRVGLHRCIPVLI
jgi:hypothetical protein